MINIVEQIQKIAVFLTAFEDEDRKKEEYRKNKMKK
jgi:hypothetical protein